MLRENIQIKLHDKSYIYIYAGDIGLIIISTVIEQLGPVGKFVNL